VNAKRHQWTYQALPVVAMMARYPHDKLSVARIMTSFKSTTLTEIPSQLRIQENTTNARRRALVVRLEEFTESKINI